MANSQFSSTRSGTPTAEKPAIREEVGRSGIYPASGPLPPGPAETRGQGALAHPEERQPRALLTGSRIHNTALLLGRALFGGYFIYNGLNHFQNRAMMVAYAQSKNVPAAGVAVAVTGAMLLAGGVSLLAGVRPKVGSSLVTTFLMGVSPQMHAFWKEQDPQQQMAEMVNFTKNMALVGGAMFAAALPEPWPYAPGR